MKYIILPIATLAFALSSCTNFDTRAQNDAATGALIGGAAGAVLGDDDNRAGSAALGAALGGGAGYVIGANR
jgi:hypothetical protein